MGVGRGRFSMPTTCVYLRSGTGDPCSFRPGPPTSHTNSSQHRHQHSTNHGKKKCRRVLAAYKQFTGEASEVAISFLLLLLLVRSRITGTPEEDQSVAEEGGRERDEVDGVRVGERVPGLQQPPHLHRPRRRPRRKVPPASFPFLSPPANSPLPLGSWRWGLGISIGSAAAAYLVWPLDCSSVFAVATNVGHEFLECPVIFLGFSFFRKNTSVASSFHSRIPG